MKLPPSVRAMMSALVPLSDLRQWDLDAINGRNMDLPKFRDHDSVLALCRHFVPVHRKRADPKSTDVVKDDKGEDIWIVGKEEMPRSQMLALARNYIGVPGRFRDAMA